MTMTLIVDILGESACVTSQQRDCEQIFTRIRFLQSTGDISHYWSLGIQVMTYLDTCQVDDKDKTDENRDPDCDIDASIPVLDDKCGGRQLVRYHDDVLEPDHGQT